MTATTHGPRSTGDEWQVDRLDLDAYLARINHQGPRTPDLETLVALHRAHVAVMPFENLDIVMGAKPSMDLGLIQEKLVGRQRGGTCSMQGSLFGAALQRLGFDVQRVVARISTQGGPPRSRSHLALVVQLEGSRWLADVGMGFGLLEPLPFDGEAHSQGEWSYRLLAGDDGEWRFQDLQEGGWTDLYSFSVEERAHAADLATAFYATPTSPRSPFANMVVVVRKDDHVVHRLLGRQLILMRPGGRVEDKRVLTDAEFVAALRDVFDITLTTEEATRLVAALPAPGASPWPGTRPDRAPVD